MLARVLTTILLGALVTLFAVWLMSAAYPAPTYEGMRTLLHKEPGELLVYHPEGEPGMFDLVLDYEMVGRILAPGIAKHNRNVVLILVAIGVALFAGTRFSPKVPVVSDGIALGGVLTVAYSVILACQSSPKIAAVPIGVGLGIAILLAYDRFGRTATPSAPRTAASE
jgi:hypothetical protein